MNALIAWLQFLSAENAAMGASLRQSHDPPQFRAPAHAPDPANGAHVFEKRCADCHGKDGAGLPSSRNPAEGYLFPPLWGPSSFNNGAGMAHLDRMTGFVRYNMPQNAPGSLSQQDAYDVSAYVLAHDRPAFKGSVPVEWSPFPAEYY